MGQLNSAAAGGSCEGPWSVALNGQLSIDGALLRLPSRIRVLNISIANPIGGLDQLLHGSGRLRGWGTTPSPDPVLYHVRGFDAAARRFNYEVNPRFGATDAARSTLRAPFRLTLDFSVNLSPDFAQQQLERYLGPGRGGRPGPRLTIDELRTRYARNVGDPYRAIIAEADSLLLSREQVDALAAAGSRYRLRIDSLWSALATEFSEFGDRYDVAAAVRRQESALEQGREMSRADVRSSLGDILTPIQLRLMPGFVSQMYRAKEPIAQGGRTLRP